MRADVKAQQACVQHTSGEVASRRESKVERERRLIFVELQAALT
jgi:hypothetical protein